MIKAHKRKNSGSMRRASRVYLTCANIGKITQLRLFLLLYVNVVNYFIERFWTMKDFTPALADKVITGRAVNRFKITARLAQCAAKQAKEIVRSQKDRKVKTMPLLRRKVATLDNRFVKIEEFKGAAFDLGLSFASGMPKITIPINQTAHMNRFGGHGWQTGSTIRLGMNDRGVWIELIFEKERPELRTEGRVIGIDRGFRKAFVTSDGQEIGAELRDQIVGVDKRSKKAHRRIRTELLRSLGYYRVNLDGAVSLHTQLSFGHSQVEIGNGFRYGQKAVDVAGLREDHLRHLPCRDALFRNQTDDFCQPLMDVADQAVEMLFVISHVIAVRGFDQRRRERPDASQ